MYTEIKKFMGYDPFTLDCGDENKNLTLHATLIVDEFKALTIHIEIKDENDSVVHEYRLTLTKNLIKNLQDSIPKNQYEMYVRADAEGKVNAVIDGAPTEMEHEIIRFSAPDLVEAFRKVKGTNYEYLKELQ